MNQRGKHRYYNHFNRTDEASSTSGRRGRHPNGLKGREIGLWYANRNKHYRDSDKDVSEDQSMLDRREYRRQQKEIQLMNRQKKPLGSILISENKKNNINQLLNETDSIYQSSFLVKTNSYEHLEETDFKHEFLQNITGNIINKLRLKPNIGLDYQNDIQDQVFLEELKQVACSSTYQTMQNIRKKLPSMAMKDKILDLIDKNQVVVISGETGCGKTTQVAQFILDDFIQKGKGSKCKIICTQPRRISAIAVAERVAKERDEELGHSVGFKIRLEKTMPRDRGSILFCTTGVLLKYMESDPSLSDVSHLLLDEIHERNITSDFLITLLRDVIQYRTDIKIILMSATLNSEAFSKYYNSAPHINIPGFTYPVEEYFLEDALQLTGYRFENKRPRFGSSKIKRDYIEPYLRQLEAENKYNRQVIEELRKDESEKLNIYLIFELLKKLCVKNDDDGAILIFVPGFNEIRALCELITDSKLFPTFKYIVIPLHSQLPTVDQKRIFNTAPKGMRKIIIATNIAETSITIDDVTVVIDSGFIKMSNIDPESGIETLQAEWVSQANASQRKGRAGRVKSGICFHLVSKVRYELLDKYLKPEVLRKRLEDVILQLKMLQLGEAEHFLGKLMDPPENKSIQQASTMLKRLGALDHEENLTPLGFHMAKLPVGPQCSKMLILGALFSCVDPILSVAASLGFKDAYQLSTSSANDVEQKRYELSNRTNSDHLCMHYAIRGFENAANPQAFCRKYYLSPSILRLLIDMRQQFAQQLFEMKFTHDANPRSLSNNRNSDNISLIKAIISAGLYPNVAILRKVTKYSVKITNVLNEGMAFHPKSVLCQVKSFPSPLFVYQVRLKSTSDFIHDGTVVFPLPLVFFGDQFRIHNCDDNEDNFNGVSINGTMRFVCSESTSLIIQKLRDRLNQILEWKLSHPGSVNWNSVTPELKMLRVIMDLITTEDSENLDLSDYDDV